MEFRRKDVNQLNWLKDVKRRGRNRNKDKVVENKALAPLTSKGAGRGAPLRMGWPVVNKGKSIKSKCYRC